MKRKPAMKRRKKRARGKSKRAKKGKASPDEKPEGSYKRYDSGGGFEVCE